MSRTIHEIMKKAEGRYLTSEESKKVMDAGREYERLLAISRLVEQHESEIVRQTVERVFQKFPKFHADRPQSHEKAVRDISLVLRYALLAMVNSDPEMLREKLLYWLRTILKAMEFGDVTKYTYETLQESVTKALPQPDAEEVNKYVRIAVEVLA